MDEEMRQQKVEKDQNRSQIGNLPNVIELTSHNKGLFLSAVIIEMNWYTKSISSKSIGFVLHTSLFQSIIGFA